MKYIYKCTVLPALAVIACHLPMAAQGLDEVVADTLQTDNNVPVAFAKTPLKETLGGVSVVDVEELTRKNYNTYSLD
ncbi:hypothetical protein, partial [Hallella bergensis]|uniref:hypothetical protein n=1 Tax=Hallella bergensis TaxID=242750 RepID=UPI003990B6AA